MHNKRPAAKCPDCGDEVPLSNSGGSFITHLNRQQTKTCPGWGKKPSWLAFTIEEIVCEGPTRRDVLQLLPVIGPLRGRRIRPGLYEYKADQNAHGRRAVYFIATREEARKEGALT